MRPQKPRARPSAGPVALMFITLALSGTLHAQTRYHISPIGDDRNDGKTPATAWRMVARVNSQLLHPGDQVLFERGGEWRECLAPGSSGIADRPIVFGTYGLGPKPKLWGSDLLDKGGFQPGAGGIFEIAVAKTVHAVLIDHQFFRNASLVSRTADPTANLDHVKSHFGSWYSQKGMLYLNTGSVDPRTDPRTYTVVVREDLVSANGKHHLTFRDLVVDETARFDSGYGFRVQGSSGVRLEGCEAYRCGKHHFGVINSTGFVGEDLLAAFAMPDQGAGGASAFVSYSDRSRRGDTSQYLRCTAEHMEEAGNGGKYPTFVTHGEGIGSILLERMTSHGGDISLGNGESGAEIRVKGGRLEDAVLGVHGDKIVVDGLTVVGEHAGVTLEGKENVLQNMLITGCNPGFTGYQAAITEGGMGNTIRFCTVAMDPKAPNFDAAISLKRPGSRLRWHGNILLTTGTVVRAWFSGFDPVGYIASFNFYSREARFDTRYDGRGSLHTLDRWKALGLDSGSLAGDPMWVAPAKGDYSLSPGSPAIDAARLDAALLGQVSTDLLRRSRLQGGAFDMGAFESSRDPSLSPRSIAGSDPSPTRLGPGILSSAPAVARGRKPRQARGHTGGLSTAIASTPRPDLLQYGVIHDPATLATGNRGRRGIAELRHLGDDVERRPRATQPQGGGSHRFEPHRVVEEPIDLVGDDGQVVAPDRRPLFQQVVRVPLLLTGDGAHHHESQPSGHRLGGGQPARLAADEVRRRHVLVHLRRVADDLESDLGVGGQPARQSVEAGLQLLVATADRHDLRRVADLQE